MGAGSSSYRRLAVLGVALVVWLVALPGAAHAEREAQRAWTLTALELQHRLADDVGMVTAPWVGTHNSFNSPAEMGLALSAQDANQRMTIVDQLREGVRSLELDVHRFLNAEEGRVFGPIVCHALPENVPCSIEKGLGRVLAEIAAWLAEPENADEVILLYLEDHLRDPGSYDLGARVVERELGHTLHRPPSGRCTEIPDGLTRNDVRDAGAQVVIVSDCGLGEGWPGVAFHWDSHLETRPVGYTDFPECGPDFTREEHRTRIVRYFEDRTMFTATTSLLGLAELDERITPETAAAMARCGVNLTGLDHVVRGDGRLAALVWSWAPGQPGDRGCAVQIVDARFPFGRWAARRCAIRRPPACRAQGRWLVVPERVRAGRAERACARRGARHAVPRTGFEAQLLRRAMRRASKRLGGEVRQVWLGYRRGGGTWHAMDER